MLMNIDFFLNQKDKISSLLITLKLCRKNWDEGGTTNPAIKYHKAMRVAHDHYSVAHLGDPLLEVLETAPEDDCGPGGDLRPADLSELLPLATVKELADGTSHDNGECFEVLLHL